jgi:hypothetical protein
MSTSAMRMRIGAGLAVMVVAGGAAIAMAANASAATPSTPYKCQSVQGADSATAALLLDATGLSAPSDSDVGINCTPVSVVGVGSGDGDPNFCGTQAVGTGLVVVGHKPTSSSGDVCADQ